MAALAQGDSRVRNLLKSADIESTCRCFGGLGISIRPDQDSLIIAGKGLQGLNEPESILDCGNSGTTMRLLCGLLAGQNFFSVLTGDQSLGRRPMGRVIDPLRLMGAEITGRDNSKYPPLAVKGKKLQGILYEPAVASAQLKSALLLAGLMAESPTVIKEKVTSRDHTEKMLQAMGADLSVKEGEIRLKPGKDLAPQEFLIPGDISSAAFFLVLASIVPGSELMIRNVGINSTRDGILEALGLMGADLKIENMRVSGGETVADILVRSAGLKAVNIDGQIIPRLIDELPVLAVAMAVAEGDSVVSNAGELRVKETDRIKTTVSELGKLGVEIIELPDGFAVSGNRGKTKGTEVDSHGDHRIAMSLAVASQICPGRTIINNSQAVNISFPEFWDLFVHLTE